MSLPLSSWLALREPADRAARSLASTRAVADLLPRDRPVHVLDLATGTGSNFRYLTGHLPNQQHWLLVDNDPAVLAALPGQTFSWAGARGYRARTTLDGLV